MRYVTLNARFWDSVVVGSLQHYETALSRRGWRPDWDEEYKRRETRREAWEVRCPRNEDTVSYPTLRDGNQDYENGYSPSVAALRKIYGAKPT
jgi:hypothetical protein